MLGVDGTLHLIGLYEDQPLSLPSGKIQRRRLLGGYYGQPVRPVRLPAGHVAAWPPGPSTPAA